MKAKSKTITKESLESLNLTDTVNGIQNFYEYIEILEPEKRKSGILVESVDDLIEKLSNKEALF